MRTVAPADRETRQSRRGAQLAAIRRLQGMTQAEVARELGVSRARVSRIECGDVAGVDILAAYVAALGGELKVVAVMDGRARRIP